MRWYDLPWYEIVMPIIVWSFIFLHHLWLVKNHVFSPNYAAYEAPSVYSFFAQTRIGWVKQNHLTGQAAANSTRDYIRVVIFFAGNAVLLAGITGGYCASSYDPNGNAMSMLLTVKLGVISFIFFVIFFVFIYATRYGTHFHMLMNVKEINGVALDKNLGIIDKVYHKSHFFYSSGLRLYFLLIPAFCWVLSCWLMVAITPIYLYLVTQYDDLGWLQDDIDKLFETAANEDGDDAIVVQKKA